MGISFQWDLAKAKRNINKHGIRFEEAVTVFRDPLSMTVVDDLHSFEEEQFAIMGVSTHQRLLVVVHVEQGDTLRIISARRATARERTSYELGQQAGRP